MEYLAMPLSFFVQLILPPTEEGALHELALLPDHS